MTSFPKVSDHAVLLYLQRAHGLNIPAIRRHIAELVKRGVEKQGDAVIVEGVKFVLNQERVITVLDRRWHHQKRVECGDA